MARLEHRLQPVVNYGIMPVFALANARGAVAGWLPCAWLASLSGRIIRIIHFNTGVFPVCSRIKFGSTQVQVWFNFAL